MFGYWYPYSFDKANEKFAKRNLGRAYKLKDNKGEKDFVFIVVGYYSHEDNAYILVSCNDAMPIDFNIPDAAQDPKSVVLLDKISGKPLRNVYVGKMANFTKDKRIKSNTAKYPVDCLNCGQPAVGLFTSIECTGCLKPRI